MEMNGEEAEINHDSTYFYLTLQADSFIHPFSYTNSRNQFMISSFSSSNQFEMRLDMLFYWCCVVLTVLDCRPNNLFHKSFDSFTHLLSLDPNLDAMVIINKNER